MEWAESKKIISEWEGMVVPNLVALSALTYQRKKNEVFTVGFLSRVDPKKGLDILIKALSAVNHNYLLKVAGSGDDAYLQSLKQLAAECGITNKIEWVGWKNSEEKFQFFSELDLFALTSHSENFAVVVIEALSVGTPVLVSNNVGLFTYVKNNSYGWVTDMQIDKITDTLNNIMNSGDKLLELNTTLPALIREDFEYEILTKRYIELYNMAIK
jgi:glycosyltransferase involved in cell wall biosynthesis